MTIIFTILFLAAFLLSLLTFWRSGQKIGKKITLILIRSLIFIVLYCAFFQPSFRITRLAPMDNVIPVLIDVSSSMQLFNADSIIKIFHPYYPTHIRKDKQVLPKFAFFSFGDSLRPIPNPESLKFKDKNSIFPRFFNENLIKRGRWVIILSDGNWSNNISSKNILYKKQCYYIPMQQTLRPSYIQIETPNQQKSVSTDTAAIIIANINGYKQHDNPIDITCRNRQRIISRKSISADSGFFNETIIINLPTQKAGTNLFELSAELSGDSVKSTCYILFNVIPGSFSTYLYSSQRSLDRRFLTLALNRRKNWNIINNPYQKKKPNLLIFFNWDKQAQQLLNKLPKSSVAFIGCLPCDKQRIHTISSFTPSFLPEFKHILNNCLGSDFPPPSGFFSCPSASYSIQRILLSLDTLATKQELKPSGYPLMFEAQYRNHLIFVLAVRGIWRWDFWPKSIDKNIGSLFFSDFLIDRMETLIQYNRNQAFYMYPDMSPIYETDSLSLKLALPSYLQSHTTISTDFLITSTNGDTVYESSNRSTLFQPHALSMKTPPLKRGTYQYTCSITTDTGRITYSDSIKILADNSELRVSGQNVLLLNEFARPLLLSDTTTLGTYFTPSKTVLNKNIETITRTIRLNRSWYMLIIIFTLFSMEWILRRIWKLD